LIIGSALQTTYNLTINHVHTYYVNAGSSPVLVHNSTCIGLAYNLGAAQAANPVVDSLRNTGELPSNYVTKQEAYAAGWSEGKALGNYIPNGQIGGDEFKNTNNVVPSAPGREWYEADIGLTPMMTRAKQPGT
jgi:hypothetical protein